MYRLASRGLTTPPCGVPHLLRLPPVTRRFPSASRSSIGVFSHSLMSCSTSPVDDAARHTTQQLRMRDRVEVFRQIGVHDIGVAPAEQPVHFLDRVAALRVGADSHRHCPRNPPRRSVRARAWRQSESPDPESSECRAGVLRLPASGSSPAAPAPVDTSSRRVPRAGPPATLPALTPRSARTSSRPRPARPHWREPAA